MSAINRAIGRGLAAYLTKILPGYQRIDAVSAADVAAVLQAGDILLVEGNTRISTAIKYLTQSSWSHACLYVGGGAEASEVANLLEADLNHGVRLVSVERYANFNLRICRPVDLSSEDTERLISFAKSKLGHRYDLKNVFDLIRYLIQKPAVPNRYRRAMIGLGSGEPTRAICSTLIAESFQFIDYPILPGGGTASETAHGIAGEQPQFKKRHFTLFTPRDFDLSPYFAVVKPTIEKGFDYSQLNWRQSKRRKGTTSEP
ncbi:MAG TPA: lipo-like protein [Gammaproteobacteria bacterium]|nr:lipo-like protein [Gammaproteobacteria bacterium]HAT26602.1 lipo-like protein [Gammaproteobacteria bacterium]HIA58415.1 lipo-like protein [Gammaproteobacteria bacterium]